MAFEELKENANLIQEEAKAYAESTIQYYKLWGFKVAMKSIRGIVKALLIFFSLLMVLLFGSMAAAFAIGDALQSTWLGFLIVAGAYLLFMILLLFARFKFIERQILRKSSDIFFND